MRDRTKEFKENAGEFTDSFEEDDGDGVQYNMAIDMGDYFMEDFFDDVKIILRLIDTITELVEVTKSLENKLLVDENGDVSLSQRIEANTAEIRQCSNKILGALKSMAFVIEMQRF